jgi:hypothetical protein
MELNADRRPLFSGHPHHDYARHRARLEEIFTTIFPNWTRQSGVMVQGIAMIKKSTLQYWRASWRKDHDWRPWRSQVHSANNRAFTDEQEQSILEEIITKHIIPGKMFNAYDFRSMMLEKWESLGCNRDSFVCSQQFIQDFKRPHKISSRRFHMRRGNHQIDRPDVQEWVDRKKTLLETTDPDRNHQRHCPDVQEWVDKMKTLLETTDPDRLVNGDETSWRVIPMGLLTWAPVGEDGVAVVAEASEKDAITSLASITGAHRKLPLYLIAKGLTQRAERGQFGPYEGHESDHSPSGWTTGETFQRYLNWLRSLYPDQQPIHLVLDMYSVHRSEKSRAVARELGIQLHFIPPGWTDELQPLDRYVFRALKSVCRRLFHRHHHLSDGCSDLETRCNSLLDRSLGIAGGRCCEKGVGNIRGRFRRSGSRRR